ncbi:hypothetical protein SGGMMB4_03017 [Sodalis glossinidius str. 'morsitans']|uniref:Uncharacterized protein n=1 Tax=Sodalis glossinidius (strain morsitans) TaxID=343509 RepID=A0A193QJK2_SODGM|nr:hypothetical protein SGGMMB4_03017 [Sodalis glossinidius str. 'morsitans']
MHYIAVVVYKARQDYISNNRPRRYQAVEFVNELLHGGLRGNVDDAMSLQTESIDFLKLIFYLIGHTYNFTRKFSSNSRANFAYLRPTYCYTIFVF